MSYEDCISLPTIDFCSQDLRPGSSTWNSVKSQVRKAAETYGSFQVLFKEIPEELKREMNEGLEQLFKLPLETKQLNVSEKPFHGYIGSSSSLYESLGMSDPQTLQNFQNFTTLFWPQGNHHLSKTLHSFSERMMEIDEIIRRMIVESLGLEKYLEEHINSTYYFLRVAKYEAPETGEKRTGLRPHTDKNILSIFSQNQVDGLEIQSKNGEWIPIKFSPDSFVVIIGESLNAWTNGRLYSPYHRVMMSGKERRYSTSLFSVPREGYIIRAVEELVDEQHPLICQPFDYTDYLKRRFEDNADILQVVPTLNNYFGV
ncbi:probable 2-oxoglutarate-dependent dioxygenase AOP1 [Euphorbia lathyris]|uniref:probable 2-oxoglutarate-dependent dioxygenase AOP1 n=1 Tax=Euphorbia lathyris TaxID=212925 RepID=UPI0033139CEB